MRYVLRLQYMEGADHEEGEYPSEETAIERFKKIITRDKKVPVPIDIQKEHNRLVLIDTRYTRNQFCGFIKAK